MVGSIGELEKLLNEVKTFKETMNMKYDTELKILNSHLEQAHDSARQLKRSLVIKLLKQNEKGQLSANKTNGTANMVSQKSIPSVSLSTLRQFTDRLSKQAGPVIRIT